MKFLFPLSFAIIFGITHTSLNAQKYYDIQLNAISQNIETEACYDVQLRSSDLSQINLGGQNYRLYYDASVLSLDEEKSMSFLPDEDYTPLMLKDDIQGADANGVGSLPYESSLGFVNFGIDLNNTTTGGIDLPVNGDWVTTARVCFQVKENLDLSEPILHWAREELTKEYATAFVEVSEWIAPNVMTPALANDFFDEMLTSIEENHLANVEINIYPNPTTDRIKIEMDFPKPFEIELWNTAGILVINKKIDQLNGKYELELKDLPAGNYSLLINDGANRSFHLIEKVNF